MPSGVAVSKTVCDWPALFNTAFDLLVPYLVFLVAKNTLLVAQECSCGRDILSVTLCKKKSICSGKFPGLVPRLLDPCGICHFRNAPPDHSFYFFLRLYLFSSFYSRLFFYWCLLSFLSLIYKLYITSVLGSTITLVVYTGSAYVARWFG